MKNTLSVNIVDIVNKRIFAGRIVIKDGKIAEITETNEKYNNYILPGFVDSHIHIESSMLIPSEFARIASIHGTVATVSDPHEIANVMGIEGVNFMLNNKTNFKTYFGAPSCVPATSFETSGAVFNTAEIEKLMKNPKIKYLSEVMNFPAVINRDSDMMAKIEIAKKYNKPIDGHAPGLTGENLKKYFSAGITADHEAMSYEEALEKIENGVMIQIREGSAAKNFDALHPLIKKYPDKLMFCSDDLHPDELLQGHINLMVKKALQKGYDFMDVLQIASYNPIKHYNLDVGLLQKGDPADFIMTKNLHDFSNITTYINGIKVAENGKSLLDKINETPINKFITKLKTENDFKVRAESDFVNVISALDGQLFTKKEIYKVKIKAGYAISDAQNDILKIVVVNRYFDAKPMVAFIKNFGLKTGAIASSVAHDSHNIIAVGCSDAEISKAVNLIIQNKGGLSWANKNNSDVLPLPFAGLMTDAPYNKVAKKYREMENVARKFGSKLKAPYMTLSFMALPVIPELKLTDKGLFDVSKFGFIKLFTER